MASQTGFEVRRRSRAETVDQAQRDAAAYADRNRQRGAERPLAGGGGRHHGVGGNHRQVDLAEQQQRWMAPCVEGANVNANSLKL